jgi:hypothetical protein
MRKVSDHIITKSNSYLLTGTLIFDISDHFLNFVSIPLTKTHKPPNQKLTRQYSYQKMVTFKTEICKLRWNNVYSSEDTNVGFDTFWDDFHTLFELYFPLTRTKLNRNVHKVNEFMTAGLLISRSSKIKLHKLALLNPSLYYNQYKAYCNMFNSTLRLSKKLFLEVKFI